MAINFLEQLVAEWYEFRGYFVRRNVRVGKRPKGGYEGELDVVAFNPETKHLVHIEPSTDTDHWDIRQKRYEKKFGIGKLYIPSLFRGFELLGEPDQIALFLYGSAKNHPEIGGGKVLLVKDFMSEIRVKLAGRSIAKAAIPEQFVILRTLQLAMNYWVEASHEKHPA